MRPRGSQAQRLGHREGEMGQVGQAEPQVGSQPSKGRGEPGEEPPGRAEQVGS